MSELAETMDELNRLYTEHKEAWPKTIQPAALIDWRNGEDADRPLRLVAADLLIKYAETGALDSEDIEVANSVLGKVHSRMKS